MRYLTLAAAGLLAALSLAACDDVDDDAMAPTEPQQMPQPDPQTPPTQLRRRPSAAGLREGRGS